MISCLPTRPYTSPAPACILLCFVATDVSDQIVASVRRLCHSPAVRLKPASFPSSVLFMSFSRSEANQANPTQIDKSSTAQPNQSTSRHDYQSLQSGTKERQQPAQWPTLADASRATSAGLSGVLVDDAVSAPIGEDIGPRTRHRKAKPKPGVPFKVLKARAAAAEENDDDESENGDPLALIAVLPSELLARIFAHLDAQSIVRCSSVCRAFRAVAAEESTWRLAFALAFGLEAVHSTDKISTPILRRIDATSWKTEFAKRTDLLRQWRRARAPTVLCDARIDFIDKIALSLPHNFMLCASSTFGVATRCDPFNGKVSKGLLDASGIVHGVSLTTLGVTSGVSCVSLEADATRIVWGFHSGAVGVTTLARQGTNPRGAVRGMHFSARASHVGPVKDIAMPFGTLYGGAHSIERSPERLRQRQAMLGDVAETFVTGGMDGSVRLWSPKKALPIWIGIARQDTQATGAAARPAPVTRVALHVESGTVAAATVNGHLTLWTGIDIAALLRHKVEEQNTVEPTPSFLTSQKPIHDIYDRIIRKDLPNISVTATDGTLSPTHLILDVEQTVLTSVHDKPAYERAHLLVFSQPAAAFERISVCLKTTDEPAIRCALPCPDKDDEIICVRPDFDVFQPSARTTTTLGFVTSSENSSQSQSAQIGTQAAQPFFAERKFVCAGTRGGKLLVWDWEQESDASGRLGAWLCLDAHHTSITAIDVTEHAIVVGASDGTIKTFCPLSGQHIRTFNDRTATRHPARMLAAGQLTQQQSSRYYVSQVIASDETIVASIGSQVLAWRAEKIRTKASAAGRKATSRTGRNTIGRLWDPKMQSMKEMERDVYETQRELQQEHEERLADRQRLGSRMEDVEMDGLTEQEAFEYAMMLSRDEMEASRRANSSANELDDALEQIARAESSTDSMFQDHQNEDEDEDENENEASANERDNSGAEDVDDEDVERLYTRLTGRTSHSSSPMASPYLRGINSPPSRAWDILQNAGSSASRNTRVGDAFSKVQAVHVPRSARTSSYNSHGASSMSASMPTSRRPSQTAATSAATMLNSPHDWPSFEPSTGLTGKSPSKLDLGSPVPMPSRHTPGWLGGGSSSAHDNNGMIPGSSSGSCSGIVSPSPSSSLQARSPLGAWAHGSPSLRPVNATSRNVSSTSALSASRYTPPRRQSSSSSSSDLCNNRVHSTAANDDARQAATDDDLRFAIELSLAEERSRQDQAKGKMK